MARFWFLDQVLSTINRIPSAARDTIALAAVIDQFVHTAIPRRFPGLWAAHPRLGTTISLLIPVAFVILLFLSWVLRPILTWIMVHKLYNQINYATPGKLEDLLRKPRSLSTVALGNEPALASLKSKAVIASKILRKAGSNRTEEEQNR